MTVRSPTHAEPAADRPVPDHAPGAADADAWKARIANAVWTEIHWLMPPDRKVLIDVEGDDISVAFVPCGGGRPNAAY